VNKYEVVGYMDGSDINLTKDDSSFACDKCE
jgi:hypothetical protein